mmetsp:Transcript_126203/g.353426  ORF Transcript_126203/g.353426 Transcript_126203/m.353426 type:complete len:232 (+) Transcript_126203:1062-1757(+)
MAPQAPRPPAAASAQSPLAEAAAGREAPGRGRAILPVALAPAASAPRRRAPAATRTAPPPWAALGASMPASWCRDRLRRWCRSRASTSPPAVSSRQGVPTVAVDRRLQRQRSTSPIRRCLCGLCATTSSRSRTRIGGSHGAIRPILAVQPILHRAPVGTWVSRTRGAAPHLNKKRRTPAVDGGGGSRGSKTTQDHRQRTLRPSRSRRSRRSISTRTDALAAPSTKCTHSRR